jgi:UDP-N-acetylmuramoyl-L-alanyl-D-glutamate--2,6-diaminopimelate ligase
MLQTFKNLYHLCKAILACVYFGFPGKRITIIGVTGTDGKTTTCTALYHVIKSAHKKVALITTIGAYFDDKEFDTGLHTTTPDAFLLQKLLKKAMSEKYDYVILETTSHAIDQNRTWGISYFACGITNVTPEHLDYHKTFDRYLETKSRLLINAKYAFINEDDSSSYQKLRTILNNRRKPFISYNKNDMSQLFPHLQDYNQSNFTLVMLLAQKLGIDKVKVIDALKTFTFPKGRYDEFHYKSHHIIIDFAHTPNSLKKLLQHIKDTHSDKKIIHVFGCAGERDIYKRPQMGLISSQISNVCIFTEEDYRSENINDIFTQMKGDIQNTEHIICIQDRMQAMQKAIEIAKENSIIVLTGKGHEQSLARGNKEYPWDEKKNILTVIDDYESDA